MTLTLDWKIVQSFVGEFIASFIFGFTVYSAIISSSLAEASSSQVIVGLAVGLSGVAIIYGLSDITIAHFNPAITLASIIFGKLPVIKGFIYIIFQMLGFMLASAMALACFTGKDSDLLDFINPAPFDDTKKGNALVMELVLTAILTFIAFSVAINAYTKPKFVNTKKEVIVDEPSERSDKTILAPLTIGLTLGFLALIGFGSSGGVFNPGLVWGAVIYTSRWKFTWVYWVGQFVGGFLGAAIQVLILSRDY